jgi:nucleotide-binding universal stress UspA family protein
MAAGTDEVGASRPVLLCFDGSDGASAAIARGGTVLGLGRAVVLTVWEPFATWQPYDPATILSAPVSKLASRALDLDEIARQLAEERQRRGFRWRWRRASPPKGERRRASPGGRSATSPRRLDAATIVVGARGLSRVESVLLGSVSSAVAVHARCPVLIVPPRGG